MTNSDWKTFWSIHMRTFEQRECDAQQLLYRLQIIGSLLTGSVVTLVVMALLARFVIDWPMVCSVIH